MNFTYVEPNKFEISSEGLHTVRIQKVEMLQSKSLKDMLKIMFFVPKGNGVPFNHYMVESDARDDKSGERYFDQNLSRFYDAFDIPRDANPKDAATRSLWIGKTAKGYFKLEESEYEKNGVMQKSLQWRISYFQKSEDAGTEKIVKTEPKPQTVTETKTDDFPEDIPF